MAATNSVMHSVFLLLAFYHVLLITANGQEDTTNYAIISKESDPTKPVRARCLARNRCFLHILTCPPQCPTRSSTKPGASSYFIDCSSKCEATCKHRRPQCYGYDAICYDPRFVGGDGVMF